MRMSVAGFTHARARRTHAPDDGDAQLGLDSYAAAHEHIGAA